MHAKVTGFDSYLMRFLPLSGYGYPGRGLVCIYVSLFLCKQRYRLSVLILLRDLPVRLMWMRIISFYSRMHVLFHSILAVQNVYFVCLTCKNNTEGLRHHPFHISNHHSDNKDLFILICILMLFLDKCKGWCLLSLQIQMRFRSLSILQQILFDFLFILS